MSVLECLQARGLIDAVTSEGLQERVRTPLKVYIGFDPTADSLHLGNLMGILVLKWFQRFGHTPVVVLGGATGSIGDPSGKSAERPLMETSVVRANVQAIRKHFEKILDLSGALPLPLFFNNEEWYARVSVIDFLRDVGRHFRVGAMLAKESVKARLHSEEGISFTELSYQLFQAFDFYHLWKHEGVCLQMGGSDQWGNITAGIELIRRMGGGGAYGATWPLLTRSDGKKFGKTEEGALWLDPGKASPYQFYQYFVRLPDPDVIRLMRLLTFMPLDEVARYEALMTDQDYIPNTAQRRLAEEVTRIVHGEEGVAAALKATEIASPGSKGALDAEALQQIARDIPHAILERAEVLGRTFAEAAARSGLCSSKGEATRLIQNGGAYLNNRSVGEVHACITAEDLIGGRYVLLGAGKKKKLLIEVK
jgi:tyrosyl-tRNA synthetase